VLEVLDLIDADIELCDAAVSCAVIFDEFAEEPGILCPVDKKGFVKVEIQDCLAPGAGIEQGTDELVYKRGFPGPAGADQQQDLPDREVLLELWEP